MKLFITLFVILFFTTLSCFGVNIIKNVELKQDTLHLSATKAFDPKEIRHFSLSHPNREVFDFGKTRLKDLHIGKRFPTYIRIAQFKPNTVRVVIEHHTPYKAKASLSLLSDRSYVIPLSTQKKKKRKYKSKQSINDIFSEVEMVSRDERLRYRRDNRKVQHKPVYSLSNRQKCENQKDLIVIDAGHGGHDSGATAGGKREKDLVLSIAKRVFASLKKRGYRVYLTRKKDRFLKLSQRTKIADKKQAVAFVSIHANSVPKRKRHKVQGIETFFLQTTRDAKSQRIAARENASVLKGAGSSLSKRVIVDSVLNGPKIIESNKLAIDVQRSMMSHVRRAYKGVKDGGVRHAPFYVLVGASRPSILVEVGYISHPLERKRLFSVAYQEHLAEGIAKGIDNYLRTRKKEIDIDS